MTGAGGDGDDSSEGTVDSSQPKSVDSDRSRESRLLDETGSERDETHESQLDDSRRAPASADEEIEGSGDDHQGRSSGDAQDSFIRDEPPRKPTATGDSGGGDDGESWKLFVRDIVMSILAVALIGIYLFAISGVWPPMVAVESGSMTPNMEVNDLVFVMEKERFQPEPAHAETGVVTAALGEQTGYEQFGQPGDVIIFEPNGNDERTPIIHRAMLWVEEGENWCDRADEQYLSGGDQCAEAPNEGFITKGDSNPQYDQTGDRRLSEPVKPEWVIGTAEVRAPGLGWLRLRT